MTEGINNQGFSTETALSELEQKVNRKIGRAQRTVLLLSLGVAIILFGSLSLSYKFKMDGLKSYFKSNCIVTRQVSIVDEDGDTCGWFSGASDTPFLQLSNKYAKTKIRLMFNSEGFSLIEFWKDRNKQSSFVLSPDGKLEPVLKAR